MGVISFALGFKDKDGMSKGKRKRMPGGVLRYNEVS